MSLEVWLEAIQTVAVVVGIIFGIVQLRQLRQQREIQAGVELLQPLQWPEMAETILLVHGLPDDLSGNELRARLGENFGAVLGLLAKFESLGPLVARGHVPIDMYAQFYRGATVLCWTKLRRYVEDERLIGWPNLFEWVQWLSEKMKQRALMHPDVPAFEQFRDWKATSDYDRLCS